ncbi:MAG TPA: ATPase, partial [Acidimicrobiia bacterium]|nr:ATPase [Acidimicrobiia bacterium]
RASLGLVVAARALALTSGRAFALPEDVAALAPDVLRHRLVLSYDALAEGLGPDELIARVLAQVPPETARPAERAVGRGR